MKEIVDSLAEGLGGFLEEPLSVDVVYLGPGKGGLAGCPGLDIVEALTAILANGITLQPPLLWSMSKTCAVEAPGEEALVEPRVGWVRAVSASYVPARPGYEGLLGDAGPQYPAYLKLSLSCEV